MKEKKEAASQQTLNHLVKDQKKYDSKNLKQVQASDALVDFVAEDLIPLAVVDSTKFKKFVETLDPMYQVPSRKQLSRVLLKKKYSAVKKKVLEKLSKAETIHLTIDLWSNCQMRSYLGITGHYISEQWILESVMLGCCRVIGRHTSDNIVSWYDEIVAEFGISNKVRHIVTDSGANIKKAFRSLALPGYDEDSPSNSEDEECEEDDSVSSTTVHLTLESDVTIEHHTCFAHTLQLVVKDGLAKVGPIGTIIKKCSNLVSYVRKSTVAADVLRGEKRLQASNTTRWNSQLKMINSVLSVSESKLAELGEAPKLTSHERNILRDIMEILAPFEEATDFVQIGCVPSASYVMPCIRGLNHHVQGMVSKYHSTFVQGLKQSLRKRMAYYEEKEVYITAAILDPRFKLWWCFNETEKKEFTEMITSALERSVPATVSTVSTEDNTNPPPSKKAKTLFSFMPEPSVQSESQSTSLTNELDNYLQSSCVSMEVNPTEFWKKEKTKYPHLSKLAKEVLGVPSSSAPVKRLFSIAGKLFRPEHCNLKDARFEELMFIRCNNN